jgi:hypothetical protein
MKAVKPPRMLKELSFQDTLELKVKELALWNPSLDKERFFQFNEILINNEKGYH